MAILASIFRSDSDSDPSLGGISSRERGHSEVIIDNIEPERTLTGEYYDTLPHVIIIERNLARKVYHAEPTGDDRKDDSYGSYSVGGSFIHSYDHRFTDAIGGMYAAIPLHDRCETWDVVDWMFR